MKAFNGYTNAVTHLFPDVQFDQNSFTNGMQGRERRGGGRGEGEGEQEGEEEGEGEGGRGGRGAGGAKDTSFCIILIHIPLVFLQLLGMML